MIAFIGIVCWCWLPHSLPRAYHLDLFASDCQREEEEEEGLKWKWRIGNGGHAAKFK